MSRDPSTEGGRVAADLLAWLAPLRFLEAADDEAREACYRLRYRAVVEVGMEAADRFGGQIESDAYDEQAVHILGWDADTPVATCRLVFRGDGHRLPLETVYDLPQKGLDRVVEWGRVAIHSSRRGDGHRLFMGLAARAWLSMESRGSTTAVGVTPERLVRFFRALGFPLTVLGPPKVYWGEERSLVLCDGPAAVRMLGELWTTSDG
jgi:N-acyl-L-homoserine lactone synthetase